ncbi:MAG: glycosyltransferase family 4 protein [Candidatus Nanopelagicaceae bacterium]|jgi:UDP-GlcNAc:undecaprenyl-phosphate GlcNAc-1-phosphate transferase
MQYQFSQYLYLALATFIFVGALTPLMRKLALKIGAVDAPNIARKVQSEPVPYLGGVAIVVGVLIATYSTAIIENRDLVLASTVLIPATLMAVMGLIDDLRGLPPWPRLISQTLVGVVVAGILISTETIGTPSKIFIVDAIITTLWIVGVCNSINFFDNLDGGAAGTVTVISLFIFLIAYDQGQLLVGALAIVTAGATAGFLLWNRSPAKIYMGDAGALFLGIIVAVLTIRLNPAIQPSWKSLSIPLLLMAVPLLDTTVAVTSRIARGISPFTGGRDHLSHRLMRKGLQRRAAAISLWGLAGVYGVTAYAVFKQQSASLIILAGLTWLALYIFFIRIPHTD